MQTYHAYNPESEMDPREYGVYPRSIHMDANGNAAFMAREPACDVLIAAAGAGFQGEPYIDAAGVERVKAPLTHENALRLREAYPFTAPVPMLRHARTMGVGDRLGIATPGHIRVFEKYDALPVFAQQSIRELNLTGRTYEDVLDCASFAVFREGFMRGFGADGDHLKTAEEVQYALSCGYTMITLDCSEHIRNDIGAMTDEQVRSAYQPDPQLEEEYINQCLILEEGLALTFDEISFKRMVLIYGQAISFASEMYRTLIKEKPVDFEISIDETETPTTPLQHFFVANELLKRGVDFATMAPRFCGEFQKGVDYIGDLAQFRREFLEHAMIARHFKYKISVHSGSDKFLVFPTVGEMTEGRFHVKTAGTNWLEAMRLVAMKDAVLYREIHKYALTAFPEACKYYHVSANPSNIPDVDQLADTELPGLFEQNDARQLIHITYGLILNEKDARGAYRFRDRLYRLWRENDEAYAELLERHIGKHLEALYSNIPK